MVQGNVHSGCCLGCSCCLRWLGQADNVRSQELPEGKSSVAPAFNSLQGSRSEAACSPAPGSILYEGFPKQRVPLLGVL